MNIINRVKLSIAKRIMLSFIVNVHKHPEFLSDDGKFCKRNYAVVRAIDVMNEIE